VIGGGLMNSLFQAYLFISWVVSVQDLILGRVFVMKGWSFK